jgi:negative regulator of flagellin synthesis FlgM
MPPIEFGPLRALGAIGNGLARKTGEASGQSARVEKNEPAVVQSEVLDAGAAPVDVERVKLIRKAVEEGTYPVLPARIADAMIAAGYLLRSGQE